ncbi:phage tail sheath C-terminal domain-containing protein [Nitrosospira sp. NpAV]|uniref:phage tail sheath family protein n=1 Tax=Nitrosospira sp. NpAV TaxID=58133 RepID=UPI0005A1DEDA|nr:phage tail sheath C-terminal domain-containing protein [Nitrosospira sp. NpAV]KIO48735.1 hypothetical protein SQ11_10065 [Nitrosospira sp. NpAV]
MANYLSPGVYVEEIPSARQPIAGVGTNTVAFIGIVPDTIYYPKANDRYDPVDAREALERSAAAPDTADSAEVKDLKAKLKAAEDQLTAANNALSAEKSKKKDQQDAALLQKLQQEKSDKTDARDKLKDSLQESSTRSALTAPQPIEKDAFEDTTEKPDPGLLEEAKSTITPYYLSQFIVDVEPGDTKFCASFSDYTKRFGPFSAFRSGADASIPMYPGHHALTHAVYGFFNNGGTRCFVARVRSIDELDRALTNFQSIDEVAIISAPGLPKQADVWSRLISYSENNENIFAILDSTAVVNDGKSNDLDGQKLQYTDKSKDTLPQPSKNAAFYFPHIEVVDPAKQLQDSDPVRQVDAKYRGRTYVPPSGHIAGIYARTDEERGVHKAPANCVVRGAIDVKYYVSKPAQDLLNPQGVNVIRSMNGAITVWGARTIGGDRNGEWKYINVRRFFLFLQESIDEGTQWVVFEPNDPTLWGKIRLNVSAFLTNCWRSGALFGLTPEEAFYVKCDEELNPPEVRDVGQVITEIGVAIVRPAEFVIFRISQSTGQEKS